MKSIDAKEISKRLNKSLNFVYDHAPELGGAKVGRSWIFTEESLESALEEARRKTLRRYEHSVYQTRKDSHRARIPLEFDITAPELIEGRKKSGEKAKKS